MKRMAMDPRKALVLALLVVLTVYVSSLPYYSIVKEHMEPYTTDKICLGSSKDDMACITKDDFKLFQDKKTAGTLCLGNPPVCINESHLRMLTDGFKLISTSNGWYNGKYYHTHQDSVMRLADDKYQTTYNLMPENHDTDPRWKGQ
jgi:hypothetical protein